MQNKGLEKYQKALPAVLWVAIFGLLPANLRLCTVITNVLSLGIFKTGQDVVRHVRWSHVGFMATAYPHSMSGGTSVPLLHSTCGQE